MLLVGKHAIVETLYYRHARAIRPAMSVKPRARVLWPIRPSSFQVLAWLTDGIIGRGKYEIATLAEEH